jgi:polysaccharide pyruvyl transferase CsaB
MFRKKAPKIVISGYYGFDNCGDEAVLLAMLHCLRKLRPELRIVVLSNNPAKTAAAYGVKAVNRWKPLSVIKALLGCRLFLSGGGSLLQDATSQRSPRYYLWVIRLARLLAAKTMIYGQGVGPLTNKKNRLKTAKVFNRCHEITVRDGPSAALLKELGVERDIQVTCDPVLALSYQDIDRGEIKDILRDMGILDGKDRKKKPLLLVTIRCWGDNRHLAPVAQLLDAQARGGNWDVLLVPAHFPGDMEAIDKIGNLMTERLYCLGVSLTARQFLALTAYADKVFAMRLHGLVCAMAMGAPMLGLSYDPKVDAFMEQAGLSEFCLSFEDFNWETAGDLLEEMETMPLDLRKRQESRRQEMQKLAWATAQRAVELLS